MPVYHASCTLSFLATQKRPDFCRDAFEDVKNDKQEMPKMECKRQGSVIAKRERLLYLPFACEGKRGNRTRPSGLSRPFLSLSHRVRKRHELDFPIRGLAPRCRYAVDALRPFCLIG